MSTLNEKDYYGILEVSPTATRDEIRKARNLRLKFFHPDRYQHDPELRLEAERKTKEINQAYEILSDPESRARYDRARRNVGSQEARLADLYQQASLFLDEHRWLPAIPSLRELLAIDPTYRDAPELLRLAWAALKQDASGWSKQAGATGPTATRSYCQGCGRDGPTRHAAFQQNIGALVMRFRKRVEGELCGKCISKYFWEYSLVTLFFGWWGFISFFASFAFLFNNVANYLPSLTWRKRAVFLAAVVGIPLLVLSLPAVLGSWRPGPYAAPQALNHPPTPRPSPTGPLAGSGTAEPPGLATPTPVTGTSWQLARQHAGEHACVSGTVHHTRDSGSTFFIHFAADDDAFYAYSHDWYWEAGQLEGDCLRICGTVWLDAHRRPWILIKDPAEQVFLCW